MIDGLRKVMLAAWFFACLLALRADAQTGIASVYSGERTANGEYANATRLTAAHKSLPFGTLVRVTNKRNRRSVVVRINDRGPFVRGRIVDRTPAAAKAIGCNGLAPVDIAIVHHS
jgi:rare lipoprotein A